MSDLLVITGASRGIGLATARRFLARGAAVVNLSRSPCPLPGVLQLSVDLALPGFEQALAAPLAAAAADRDRVVLIHNAAVFVGDSALDVDSAVLARALAVNIVAPAVLNRLLIPTMKRGSSIVYVGSTLSEKAVAGVFSYVVSKHAVVGMMRATCQDLLGRGIHTVCVCPGVTDTEMIQQRVGGDQETLATLRSMTGEGRLIEPDEIAAILEMAADHPVLNGTLLHANLGQREQ
jgi:NAD(P)-dependent dehydrogenase (short-subunit alcohol dehydrogenase family)